MSGGTMIGFILSRMAAGEAEILSVAIAPARRGRGFARPLLDLHLRRLAGLGTRAVFLEVDENNAPARAAVSPRRLPRSRAGARAIIKAARRRWYCAAISADAPSDI